ncbi:Tyrosine--tRNA ligase, chloroplastic/mitochondrial [Sesamum alatum]|uniref:Tyrosine--tRNA ligase, chloroplastic/mitochondrial n=1 Tax=Sesamum alatum TaxID=300844 RepID=A0AAE1Y0M4_9LAMI|nr:Tyrosine--tRNA ligase, chloroplastic/mitochondrial [Sesamum alatum]
MFTTSAITLLAGMWWKSWKREAFSTPTPPLQSAVLTSRLSVSTMSSTLPPRVSALVTFSALLFSPDSSTEATTQWPSSAMAPDALVNPTARAARGPNSTPSPWTGTSVQSAGFPEGRRQIREVGAMMSIERARDSESEQGMSYTEFTYQLLQAYDFLSFFRDEGVTLPVLLVIFLHFRY